MDKVKIMGELEDSFKRNRPRSWAQFQRSEKSLIRGGSHNLRLFSPFPFYDVCSSGSKVTDLDGFTYIDFWQGYFTNMLGHNPPVVTEVLRDYFAAGQGLITGFPGSGQVELAELILQSTGMERIRFTTSGTLATMYATMLARAFTGRALTVKVGGGWHGAHPCLLKGVGTFKDGLNQIESAGLPSDIDASTLIVRYNDLDDLAKIFNRQGDRIASMIIEPMVGTGGLIFAEKEFMDLARRLTHEHGALLIVDEVISAFRFCAGPLFRLYDVWPDLLTLGKCIGGGLPIGALAGREEVMALCGPNAGTGRQVRFDGGTFSALPATMAAGKAFLEYLIENESDIYPTLGALGDRVREGIEKIFKQAGMKIICSSDGRPLTENSSLVGVHFLNRELDHLTSPDQAWNPEIVDFELREKIFKLAMIEEGVHTIHGFGGISAAHSKTDIEASLEAVERIAKKWSK